MSDVFESVLGGVLTIDRSFDPDSELPDDHPIRLELTRPPTSPTPEKPTKIAHSVAFAPSGVNLRYRVGEL